MSRSSPPDFQKKFLRIKIYAKTFSKKTLTECHAHFQMAFFFSFFRFFLRFLLEIFQLRNLRARREGLNSWFKLKKTCSNFGLFTCRFEQKFLALLRKI
ncbi:hypothetical protein ACM39_16505 [Chryseobacterium sp. FH2]|nr:hypothetical protein ACM39_16505 [Chryseobacterium sp. FH2]